MFLCFYLLQKDVEFIVFTDVEDYNGTRITVDVPAGVLTQSFTIDIIDNDIVECDEMFSITIENVTTCGVTTGDVISSNVTIVDDDGEWSYYSVVIYNYSPTEAVLSLNQTEYSVSEDDGQLLVGVALSRVTSQDVTVLVTITDGTTTGNIVNPMTT